MPETVKGLPLPLVLSLADTVKVTVPAEVGVPDSTPVAVEKLNPAGMVPELIVSEE